MTVCACVFITNVCVGVGEVGGGLIAAVTASC